MKIVLFVVLLAALIGGALGGAAYMKVGPFAEKPRVAQEPPPPIDLAAAPSFLKMDTLMVPVIDGKTVRKQIFLEVELEVAAEQVDHVNRVLPRLQNAFLIDLNQFIPGHLRDRPTPNLALTKARLLKVADRTLGPGKVKDVLIKSAYDR